MNGSNLPQKACREMEFAPGRAGNDPWKRLGPAVVYTCMKARLNRKTEVKNSFPKH